MFEFIHKTVARELDFFLNLLLAVSGSVDSFIASSIMSCTNIVESITAGSAAAAADIMAAISGSSCNKRNI